MNGKKRQEAYFIPAGTDKNGLKVRPVNRRARKAAHALNRKRGDTRKFGDTPLSIPEIMPRVNGQVDSKPDAYDDLMGKENQNQDVNE